MTLPDITTERLRLVRWDPDAHTPALAAINAEPAAVEYLNAGVPYTFAESAGPVRPLRAHTGSATASASGRSTVSRSGDVIGFTGPAHPLWFPPLADEVEVGWRLHPSAWGNGYATEAGRAAVDAAFTHLGSTSVIASSIRRTLRRSPSPTRDLGMHASHAPRAPAPAERVAIYASRRS